MITDKVFREKRSAKGYPYWVLEDRWMPRIHDSYLDCVIYLYHSRSDAERGAIHTNGGSGFLVGIPSTNPGAVHIYAVANRHVVELSPVIRMNTKEGDMDILDLQVSNWLFTEDQDIAVCPIKLTDRHKFRWVPISAFLTKEIIAKERIGPGDDLFMVGRFVNHEGRQRNTPSVRFGNLAMMPDEPVYHKHNNPKEQLSFLADIRTIGGYSGSPVLLFVRMIDFDGPNISIGAKSTSDPWLLGVEWGHLLDHFGTNTGMSGVVPAWCLNDLLNSPQLVESRRRQNEDYARQCAKGGTAMT